MPTDKDNSKIAVGEVDMSDQEQEDKSLLEKGASLVRKGRTKVQRTETELRARRRAKAREEEMSEPGLVEELSGLADDTSELVSTAAEPASGVGEGFEVDNDGFNEPLLESEDGDNGFVDPVASTENQESEMNADDEILDPADADPFAMDKDGDDDLDDLL